MTEQKPAEQYTAESVAETPTVPTIDDESKRLAMAKAMIDNQLLERERRCGTEVNEAVKAIMARHNCVVRFMQTKDIANDQVVNVYLQAVAMERVQRQAQ